MLYEMARKYDEWPGEDYDGSSARGAMKGWMRHGVASRQVWPDRLKGSERLDLRRSRDALAMPGGAYFRVAHRQVRDVHAALVEVGIVYATLMVHDGWDAPSGAEKLTDEGDGCHITLPVITRKGRADSGHAVAFVGYNAKGFIVVNSWGSGWGHNGFALLPYEDFMLHVTDVWVAQLGVPVEGDVWMNESSSGDITSGLHRAQPAVPLAQIRPYIINIGNNGKLSDSGSYWTTREDLVRLVAEHVPKASEQWSRRRVMLYLHGGLNSEEDGAERCTAMLGKTLANEIYPVHVLWETGFMETVRGCLENWFSHADKLSSRTLLERISDGRDYVLERSLAPGLQGIWSKMKANAAQASRRGGAMHQMAEVMSTRGDPKDWELHIVAHSAGAIFFAHLLRLVLERDLPLKSVQLLAPAATTELFKQEVLPGITSGNCPLPVMYQLNPDDELNDHVGSSLVYGKSLLYLVSRACEPRRKTPILGMDDFVKADAALKALWAKRRTHYILSGSPQCDSRTHGGFDNDPATMNQVLTHILGGKPAHPFTARDLRF